MKRGLGVIFCLITLILVLNVMAYQSTITVKTGIPNKEIIFKAADPDTGKTLEGGEFRQKSDAKGVVVFNYSLEPIRIKAGFMAWTGNSYVNFLNGKETVFVPNIILNEFVDIDLNRPNITVSAYSSKDNETKASDSSVAVNVSVNSTSEATTNVTETAVNETSQPIAKKDLGSITGAVIGVGKSVAGSKITYYIIGGFFVIGILFFIVFGFMKGKEKGTYINFKIRKDGPVESALKQQFQDQRITDAERKLEEARKELNEVKNRGSGIEEARRKLEQDKQELARLERGDGNQLGY